MAFSGASGGELRRIPAAGGPVEAVAPIDLDAGPILVDEHDVFFTDRSAGRIYRVAK